MVDTVTVEITDETPINVVVTEVGPSGVGFNGSLTQWIGTTTDATVDFEIFVGGVADSRLELITDQAFAFSLLATGYDITADQMIAVKFEGAIKRNTAGDILFVGTPSKIVLGDESSAAYDINIYANDPTKSLTIGVTGHATNSIKWTVDGYMSIVTLP